MLRQLLFFARRRHYFRGVGFDDAFAHQELEEGPQRCEFPRDGSLLFLVRVRRRQPLTNCQMIDLGERRLVSLSVLISRSQVIEELAQVAFVIPQRVRADVALVAQVIEELREKISEHSTALFVMINRVDADHDSFFLLERVSYGCLHSVGVLSNQYISKKNTDLVRQDHSTTR